MQNFQNTCSYVFLISGKDFSLEFINSWTNTMTYMHDKELDFGYVFKTGNTRHNLKNKLVSTPLADSRATGIELDSSQENSVFGGFIKPEKIIFLDSNMSWSNNDLEKLFNQEFEIICAPYVIDDTDKVRVVEDSELMTIEEINNKKDLFEVMVGGSGFLSCSLKVLEEIGFPWFNTQYVVDKKVDRWVFVDEDTYFCLRAKEEGFKVMCDPSIKVGYEKNKIFNI